MRMPTVPGSLRSCVAGYLAGVAFWASAAVAMALVTRMRPCEPLGGATLLVTSTEYGYEFAMVTAHAAGSAGALAAFAWSRRRDQRVRVVGLILAVVVSAVVLGSLRWAWSEVTLGLGGQNQSRDPFVEGVDRGLLVTVPSAFLAAVVIARFRAARRHRRDERRDVGKVEG